MGIYGHGLGLTNVCHHTNHSFKSILLYCSAVSSSFVLALYLLVPSHVRRLDRNNKAQIQWRSFVSLAICVFWTFSYPQFFCDPMKEMISEVYPNKSALQYLGWSWNLPSIIVVNFHTAILFLGPLVTTALHKWKRRGIYANYYSSSSIWPNLRNFVIAPLTEEIVFRGCIIPPLFFSTNHLSHTQISILAPLFFGMAHVHHAILKLKEGFSMQVIFFSTLLQFSYTSLFGTYASYAFIKTGSLPAVILCHAFCNKMGLPDLSFTSQYNELYRFKYAIICVYFFGISLFVYGFYYDIFDDGNYLTR